MYILGIFGNFYRGTQDPSAVLMKDGKVIAAAEEERFLRIKHAMSKMPIESIKFCLNKAKISMEEVDVLVFPQITWEDMKNKLENFIKIKFGVLPKKIQFVEHHLAHAASTYYASGMKDAMIITADWSGDGISTLLAHGHEENIDVIKKFSGIQHSLGAYYSIITDYLGFQTDLDEYKVMGLAAYGKSQIDFSWLLRMENDQIILDKKYLDQNLLLPFPNQYGKQEPKFNEKLIEKLGLQRTIGEKIEQRHMDIAFSAQKQLEVILKSIVKTLSQKTKSKNLCLAGGVMLNSVCNGVLYYMDEVEKIFVPPVSGDNGVALGAAMIVSVQNGIIPEKITHASFGPSFDNEYIEKVLSRSKCQFSHESNISKVISEDISERKIVGWFQEEMEFGPRALGNRSILGDPRDSEMKNKINQLVKFREDFRPLAPSVIDKHTEDFFGESIESPFMTITIKAKEESKQIIPAVIHIDGTSRIQTVNSYDNPKYYKLLENLKNAIGVPVVLNTSFNLSWEPIVQNPEQALATFFASGLDTLAIGDFIVRKE